MTDPRTESPHPGSMVSGEPAIALKRAFRADKTDFLAGLRTDLHRFIASQGSRCLEIIEITPAGPRSWPLAPQPAYLRRLVSFCRGRPLDGRVLDSALTRPILDRIASRFLALYTGREHALAGILAQSLLDNHHLATALVDAIVTASKVTLPEPARTGLAARLLDQIRESAGSCLGAAAIQAAGNAVTHQVRAASTAVSNPIAARLSILVLQSLAVSLKVIIAKGLSTAAGKAAIAAAIHKYVAAALLAAIAKSMALKLGITSMGAFSAVMIPLLVAYLAHEAWVFPETLGKKVSETVVAELDASFDNLHLAVLTTLGNGIDARTASTLGTSIGSQPEVRRLIAELVSTMTP